MRRLQKKRGFALIAVLGLIVLLLTYLATVQGAMLMTRSQGRLAAQRQDTAEAVASLVTMALAAPPAPGAPREMQTPDGVKGSVALTPLPEGDSFWGTTKALTPRAGDGLLSVRIATPGGIVTARYLVNLQGKRPGIVTVEYGEIGRPEKVRVSRL